MYNEIYILIAIFLYFVVFAITIKWPIFGLMSFMSITMVKSTSRYILPLEGFVGYSFDLGMVLLALVGVISLIYKTPEFKRKYVPVIVWFCIGFLIFWTWIKLPTSKDVSYGLIKALIFTIFDMAVILLGILYMRSFNEFKSVSKSLIILGIFAICGILLFGRGHQEWEGARVTIGLANPLAPADFASYILIFFICRWVSQRTLLNLSLLLTTAIFSLITIFLTGTRGPLLILPIVFIMISYAYRRTINFKLVVGLMLLAGAIYFAGNQIRSATVVEKQFSTIDIKESFNDRVFLSRAAFMEWLESPILGTGTGSSIYDIRSTGGLKYPHNMLLEVLNEFGLIGFLPFVILLYCAFIGWRYCIKTEFENTSIKAEYVLVFSCFIYHFILSFKTGSYAGSQMFYFFLGASISMSEYLKNSYLSLFSDQTAIYAEDELLDSNYVYSEAHNY